MSKDSSMSSLTGATPQFSAKERRGAPEDVLKNVINSAIDLCNNGVVKKERRSGKQMTIHDITLLIENQVLPELSAIIDQHKLHLIFVEEAWLWR